MNNIKFEYKILVIITAIGYYFNFLFALLGITHGLSLASSGSENFNIEKGITVIIPMVPSLILLFW